MKNPKFTSGVYMSCRGFLRQATTATFAAVLGTLPIFAQDTPSNQTGGTDVLQEDRYTGNFIERNGLLTGTGKYESVEGLVYQGDLKDSQFHGSGRLHFADGRAYEGTFINGQITGYGEMNWPNGNTYVGSFQNDKIMGRGRFHWRTSGESYEGTFLDAKKHGVGTYMWPDGRTYQGGFNSDSRDGFGEYHMIDGGIFRGFFSDDKRHGDGIQFAANDVKTFQRWNAGTLVFSQRVEAVEHCRLEIEGEIWMFRGSRCINGFAHGEGMAIRLDGLEYINNGRFVLGKLANGVVTSLSTQGAF